MFLVSQLHEEAVASILSAYVEHLLRWRLVNYVGGCKEEGFVM